MNKTREDLLKALEDLGNRYPDMRFGQLVANAAQWSAGPTKTAVWEVEDEKLLETLHRKLANSDKTFASSK